MEVNPWYKRHQGYLVLAVVLIFAVPLTIYNNKIQKRDIAAATAKATKKTNEKFALTQEHSALLVTNALAKKQHDDELASWKVRRGGCARNNILRTAISSNGDKLARLALELAASRRVASRLEPSAKLALHDLDVAAAYVKLAKSVPVVRQVDCVAKYPYPFPKKERHQ